MSKTKIGFIGAGNMAGAIILGGAHGAHIYDVNHALMETRREQCGAVPHADVASLAAACDVIVLAVKPNVAPDVLSANCDAFAGKAVISIVAGLTGTKLRELLQENARMPLKQLAKEVYLSSPATAARRTCRSSS